MGHPSGEVHDQQPGRIRLRPLRQSHHPNVLAVRRRRQGRRKRRQEQEGHACCQNGRKIRGAGMDIINEVNKCNF